MAKQIVVNATKCPICHTNTGEIVPQYGLIACKSCRNTEEVISERTFEVIPAHMKEERKQYKDQTIQPFRNGQLSKEYVSLYGTSRIEVTPEEVKNAKNVWSREFDYYK